VVFLGVMQKSDRWRWKIFGLSSMRRAITGGSPCELLRLMPCRKFLTLAEPSSMTYAMQRASWSRPAHTDSANVPYKKLAAMYYLFNTDGASNYQPMQPRE
jgi:hypothetical protein